MKELIENALLKLDVNNDEHWTDDGLAKLDAVSSFVGKTVKRSDIQKFFPYFSRKNLNLTPKEPSEVEFEDLEEEIANSEKELNEQEVKYQEAQARLEQIRSKRDKLLEQKQKTLPAAHLENQLAIQSWLEGQQLLREQRAEKIREYNTVNTLKAPIDAAMARKTGYGKNRPQVPLIKED